MAKLLLVAKDTCDGLLFRNGEVMVDKNLRDGEICVSLASDMTAATENEFNSCDELKLVVVVCIGWLGLFLDLTFFIAIAADSVLVWFNSSSKNGEALVAYLPAVVATAFIFLMLMSDVSFFQRG